MLSHTWFVLLFHFKSLLVFKVNLFTLFHLLKSIYIFKNCNPPSPKVKSPSQECAVALPGVANCFVPRTALKDPGPSSWYNPAEVLFHTVLIAKLCLVGLSQLPLTTEGAFPVAVKDQALKAHLTPNC